MTYKRIISILLALTMTLSVMMSAVSCSSFTTLDDDDDEREERTTNEKTEENETESGTGTSTGERTTSKRPGIVTEETTGQITEYTTEYISEVTTDYVDENEDLSYDEKSHKCEYDNHKCRICDSVVCIDDNYDQRCDVCGLEYSYIGDVGAAIIGIGNYSGRELHIPRYVGNEKVVEINPYAFSWCSETEKIYIPDGIVAIRDSAFYSNSSLLEVYIPESVELIEERVFSYCPTLIRISVSDNNSVYKSNNGCLYTKDGRVLKAICAGATMGYFEIPESVEIIEENVFENYDSLSRIILPDSLLEIEKMAFYGCSGITDITIPENVLVIEPRAFYDCEYLSNIFVNENNATFKDIDGNLYTKDGTMLLQYASGKTDSYFTTPDGVIQIGEGAFCGAINLTSVYFCEDVMTIENEAFYGCASLLDISLPVTLEKIGSYAFAYTGIRAVYIPQSVSEIGDGAFYDCNELAEISVHPSNPYYTSVDGNLYTKDMDEFIICSYGNPNTTLYIREGVERILPFAAYFSENIIEVIIADGVKIIGSDAFSQCENLESITIPASVEMIGSYAFAWSKNLKNIHFGGTVKQWKSIEKGYSWDSDIVEYTVHCIDGTVSGGYGENY